ncbi:uncharacterized protein TM35_000601050 [Trypanosoma theileri]|uniref:Mucin-associated surface protein (MASP) n=1 Tax=Trypanosoma theileri TaxID=67003 RepID=A0A1X0NFY4_9TRYP|nr:uncharacterized protein TM35_000601050 [Trypanosoma theileri]ORC83674.1 hypothetical protein TM35_000601050 [Trypanosoma theileri]
MMMMMRRVMCVLAVVLCCACGYTMTAAAHTTTVNAGQPKEKFHDVVGWGGIPYATKDEKKKMLQKLCETNKSAVFDNFTCKDLEKPPLASTPALSAQDRPSPGPEDGNQGNDSHEAEATNGNHGEAASHAAHSSAGGTTTESQTQESTAATESEETTSTTLPSTANTVSDAPTTTPSTVPNAEITSIASNMQNKANVDSSVSPVWMRTAAPLLIMVVLFSVTVY